MYEYWAHDRLYVWKELVPVPFQNRERVNYRAKWCSPSERVLDDSPDFASFRKLAVYVKKAAGDLKERPVKVFNDKKRPLSLFEFESICEIVAENS